MLSRISIRDILLIDQLELEFDNALNVLTGETGAGKSILLDCLGFVLGWRGRADIVRKGASQGEVEAEFDIAATSPIHNLLEEAGLPAADQLIIRRINSSDGRKRGFINDRSVSGDLLREVGSHLIEMHGQHDDKGLLDERGHLGLLDAFAKVDLTNMQALYREWRAAQKKLDAFKIEQAELEREAEFIRHASKELSLLAPEIGEEEALDKKRRMMQQGEKLSGELAQLLQLLGNEGIGAQMSDALSRARFLVDKMGDDAQAPIDHIETAYDQLAEAETALERLTDQMQFDARTLEETEERLFALRAAARKYMVTCDELAKKTQEFVQQSELLDNTSKGLDDLQSECDETLKKAEAEALKISKQRKSAALILDKQIQNELAPLKMENAVFTSEFSDGSMTAQGLDKLRFVVQTNPGTPAGSLSKIASGGELSRFLLALKLCLHQDDSGISMIFDEIDRGVGGQTADAVGRRLRMLSSKAQLLVVTHSPQVAALGTKHFLVSKTQEKDDTKTEVTALGQEARVHEVARMISGDKVSQEAIAAANKLIETQGA